MARTTALRAQHVAAEAMLADLFDCIEAYGGDSDAYPLSLKLARLAGTLRTHFAMEDQILYPYMIASDHHQAAVMARVFRSEIGHIGAQFDHFIDRWLSSDAIAASFGQFSYEAGMLFGAIRERMVREDRDLFPLADALAKAMAERERRGQPREASAAAASSTSSWIIAATGSSRLTMPTDWPAMTDPLSTSPSITARFSAPAQ
jgi:hypothetical protein